MSGDNTDVELYAPDTAVEIPRVARAYMEAVRRAKPEQVAKLFSKKAIFSGALMDKKIRGREGIAQYYREYFSKYAYVDMNMELDVPQDDDVVPQGLHAGTVTAQRFHRFHRGPHGNEQISHVLQLVANVTLMVDEDSRKITYYDATCTNQKRIDDGYEVDRLALKRGINVVGVKPDDAAPHNT